MRKLLIEARAAIESLEAIIQGEISRDWSDIFYADWLIADKAKSRIDAALAEPVASPDVYEFNIAHFHQTGGITSTKYTKECKTENAAYRHFLTLLEKHKVDERTYYLCKWKFLPPNMADAAPASQWRRVEDAKPEEGEMSGSADTVIAAHFTPKQNTNTENG